MSRRLVAVVVVIASGCLSAVLAGAQGPASAVGPSESQVRAFADAAANGNAGDPQTFATRFRQSIATLTPNYAGPVSIPTPKSIDIEILGPVAFFESDAAEAVRKFDLIGNVPWREGIAVVVNAIRFDAPDIEKIVLQRNGGLVQWTGNALGLVTVMSDAGVTRKVHSGTVVFPSAAFVPDSGALVVVTAVPVTGNNFAITLHGGELGRIQ